MIFRVVATVVVATDRSRFSAEAIFPSSEGPASQRTLRISSSASVGSELGGLAIAGELLQRLIRTRKEICAQPGAAVLHREARRPRRAQISVLKRIRRPRGGPASARLPRPE